MVRIKSNDDQPASAARQDAVPLTHAALGECLRITAHGLDRGTGRRLADMGLPVGAEIELVHRQRHGSVIVSRGSARMALGAEIAHTVLVAPIGEGEA